jgi:hypothetical protein
METTLDKIFGHGQLRQACILLAAVTLALFIGSCNQMGRLISKNVINVQLASVNNNVCKRLYGNVVFYAVFVDSKETKPWTDYDIRSTLDSIRTAMNWIGQKAEESGIPLNIKIAYHQKNGRIPIALNLPKKTLSGTLFQQNPKTGYKTVSKWVDHIAGIAAKALPPDTSTLISTKNELNNKERLIARLRDIYKTDNVALVFLLNNYFANEVSVTFNSSGTSDVEYSIVSFKSPSVIAHEFLHIFGAWDLYITPFDKNKKHIIKQKEFAMKEFPNEIMAFAYRHIDSLDISPFTKYCIGWSNKLDENYSKMILGRQLKPIKY